MSSKQLPISYLHLLFECDGETGELRWRQDSPRGKAGSLAGVVNAEGYRVVGHKGIKYRVHRVIWAMHYGEWPSDKIDHINGITTDNRICNLRQCTQRQNLQNIQGYSNSQHSKYKGVGFHKGKWRARISVGDGTRIELGHFATEEEAAEAYREAAKKYHGEFARF